MRAIADFDPDYAASYCISRDAAAPSPALRSQVWPEFDLWMDAHAGAPTATEQVESNLAAGAFFELLDKLRNVLLQVSLPC